MDRINEIKEFILNKTLKNAEKFDDKLPTSTFENKYRFVDHCGWVGGFWTGILYYCYLLSDDKKYCEYADKSRHRFLDRLYKTPDTLDHDVGFLYLPSEYFRYKLCGKEESLKVTTDAANEFIKRYNEKGKFLRAWNVWIPGDAFCEANRGRIIIDCMYNLPLLFEASIITGDDTYRTIAEAHAITCMNSIVREDYTTFHSYLFNHETGEKIGGRTCQGLSDSSCWSRGQAWAIGGFAMAYKYTKNEDFLRVAIATADKFIEFNEDDYVPVWDFDLRGTDAPRDTSAGAIAACGMFEIADCLSGDKKHYYKEYAEKIVLSLCNNYTSVDDDEFEALLKHGVGHLPENSAVDEGLIYGDYYFVKAVLRMLGIETIY